MKPDFEHSLADTVKLKHSDERGEVIARAEYLHSEPQYLVRYQAGDGRQTEAWWGASAIVAD